MKQDRQLVLPLQEVAKAIAHYLYARHRLPAGAEFSLRIEGQALIVELVSRIVLGDEPGAPQG